MRNTVSFGGIRTLPSGRFQARYTGPDGRSHNGPRPFLTKTDARAWLKAEHAAVLRGDWTPPASRHLEAAPVVQGHHGAGPILFGDYADTWVRARRLRPRTRMQYRMLLDRMLLPTLRDVPVRDLTPARVRSWYAALDPAHPTMRAQAYSLLRTVLGTAVDDELLPTNPCRIRGAGSARRQREVKPATLAELGAIVEATPEHYRLMVLLSSWCGLRFGEVTELRRRDVDLKAGTVRVDRAVTRADGRFIVGDPKSDAGRRTVAIPPHLMPVVREHLRRFTPATRDALLFSTPTGRHLAPSTVYRWFYPAREAAGRPDLRWHDLRHTGAVLAAATGATLAEMMARLGHSTPQAAMIYQHAAADRDHAIAAALSELAGGQVVPLQTTAASS